MTWCFYRINSSGAQFRCQGNLVLEPELADAHLNSIAATDAN